MEVRSDHDVHEIRLSTTVSSIANAAEERAVWPCELPLHLDTKNKLYAHDLILCHKGCMKEVLRPPNNLKLVTILKSYQLSCHNSASYFTVLSLMFYNLRPLLLHRKKRN